MDASVAKAIANSTDRPTIIHLEGVRDEIAKILNPDKGGVDRATGNANRQAMELLELYYNPTSCFPDYEIKP